MPLPPPCPVVRSLNGFTKRSNFWYITTQLAPSRGRTHHPQTLVLCIWRVPLPRLAFLRCRLSLRSWCMNITWSPLSPLTSSRNAFRLEPTVTPGAGETSSWENPCLYHSPEDSRPAPRDLNRTRRMDPPIWEDTFISFAV